MIAVCIPSRGLVHSRTMQDILANALGEDELGFYFSHGNPLPDAHNIIVEEALKDKPDYIWLVEDDNQLPPGILKELLDADVDVATADYPVRGDKHTVTYIGGVLQYGGLGCTLVKAEVFERLDKPYFSTDREYVMTDEGLTAVPTVMNNHGGSEVDWWQRVLQIPHIDVKVIESTAGQYFLKEPQLPKFGNDTAKQYVIETWRF